MARSQRGSGSIALPAMSIPTPQKKHLRIRGDASQPHFGHLMTRQRKGSAVSSGGLISPLKTCLGSLRM